MSDKEITQLIMNKYLSPTFSKEIHKYCQFDNNEIESRRILHEYEEYIWDQIFNQMLHDIQEKTISYSSFLTLDILYLYFLNHKITISLESPEISMKIKKKKLKQDDLGKIYTPYPIIKFMIQFIHECLQQTELSQKHLNLFHIADIACGTGRFLLASAQFYQNNQQYHPKIYGYDKDKTAIEIAQRLLTHETQITLCDSLFLQPSHVPKFDLIIGNPPYIESRMINDTYWKELRENFRCAFKKFDLSVVFLEKILSLLSEGGWAGLITTNKWLVTDYGKKIRELLLKETYIHSIFDISHLNVFEQADTYPIMIFFQKRRGHQSLSRDQKTHLYTPSKISQLFEISSQLTPYIIHQNYFSKLPNMIIPTNISKVNMEYLERFWELSEAEIFRLGDAQSPYELRKGIHTGNVKEKLVRKHSSFLSSEGDDKNTFKKLVTSREQVNKYKIKWKGLYINYNAMLIDKSQGDYGSLREEWIFQAKPKILIKLFGKCIQAALDNEGYYVNNSIILIVPKKKNEQPTKPFSMASWFQSSLDEFYYLVGILNSYPISAYYRILFHHTHVRGTYLQYYVKDLAQIPIIKPNKENIKKIHLISHLARKITIFYQKDQFDPFQRSKLEDQLNSVVSELYGISFSLFDSILGCSSN